MKAGIHPEYVDTTITCACGEVIQTRSTKPDIRVEVCSKCHPFYTGKQKFVDTAGRIQRFQEKFRWTGDAAKETAEGKNRPKKAVATPAEE